MLRMLRLGSKNLRHKGGYGFSFSPLPETRRGKLLPLAISLFLSLFLLLFNANPVLAGNVTLAWNAPTERVNGTLVTSSEIKGYNLHYGTASGNYTQTQPITGNVTTYTFTSLPNGVNYYFAVSAIDNADIESGYSSEACKTIGTTTTTCVTTTISNGGGNNNNNNFSTGGDTEIGGGGGGCGFVKNDGKGQKAKGEELSLIIMLIIALTGIALARRTGNITATKEGVLVMETRKNSLIKIAAISFLLTIFWSASAYAQPNITSFSGSLTDGLTITINGSSFGVNGPNIVVFDNFESGTNGADIKIGAGSATIGEWTSVTYLTPTPPKYSNAHSLSGSLAFRGDATANSGDNNGSCTAAYRMGFTTSDIFVSYWYYFPTTSDWPCLNGGNCNNKLVWVTGSGTTDDDRVIPATSGGNKTIIPNLYMFGNDSIGSPPLSPSLNMSKGKWYRFWVYLHGAGNATDHEELWVASPSSEANLTATRSLNRTTQIWNASFNGFNRVMINGFNRWCNDCAESAPTFDDVYVAIGTGARARVEIGDAATYATSKNLTIATVTSWSDTSITATIRQGSYSNLNNAYLYVIDADGNVNTNGLPLCPSCLKAPTWQ